MNRIYKVVFNKTIGAYTAVSELASFKGKKSVKAAVAVGLAGLMMAGSVSAAGLSGGKDGSPDSSISGVSYTGTDSSSGEYVASGGAVTADGVTVGKNLYGGFDYAASGSESRAMASSSNTVTVTNGSDLGSKNVTGGTVSAASDVTVTSVTASGNGITVEEDSVANGGVLLGASVNIQKEVTGTLTVDGNTVDVTGKSAADTKFGSVEGADVYAYSIGGDVSASGNKVSVSQAAIGSDSSTNRVQGVRLAVPSTTSEGVNLKADKNEAVLTDVELASGGVDVYGAVISSFGTAKDVSLSENQVTLSNVTSTKGDVYGVNASLSNGVKGTLDVNGNEVSVTGKSATDTKFDSVQGARVYAYSIGGDVSASGNKVAVSKAAIGDDSSANLVQGLRLASPNSGTSEGVNLKADKNEVGLTDVELASGGGDVYGANIVSFGRAKDVSLSENKAILTNVTSGKGTVYGVFASLSDGVKGKLDANGNEVSVTGKSAADTKFDSVRGADVSSYSIGGDVSASGNKVAVSKAAIGDDSSAKVVQGLRLAFPDSWTSEGVNLKADKNEAGLTDVELASGGVGVYGANIVSFGRAKDVSLSENKAILTNVTSGKGTVYGVFASLSDGVKGKLDANGNEVSVTGKSATDTKFDSVYGANVYAYSIGGDVSASGNKVTVSKAAIGDDGLKNEVQGVRLASPNSGTSEGVNLKADKNEVGLTDVELASGGVDVYGANIVSFRRAKDVSLSENKAILTNVTSGKGTVYGVNASLSYSVRGKLDVNGNEVSVTGKSAADTKLDSMYGVAVYAGNVGGDVTVSQNKASVSKANIDGDYGDDGYVKAADVAISGTADGKANVKVEKNTLTVKDTNVSGGLAGADVGLTGDEKINRVILDANTAEVEGGEVGDVRGAVLVVGLESEDKVEVGTTEVKNNSATVKGAKAYDVRGADAGGDSVTLSGNAANVSDSTVEKDIYGAAVEGKNATMSGNTVAMDKSNADQVAGAYVKGDGATLTGNTANVTDSVFFQAMAADVEGDNATVSGNTANVTRSGGFYAMGVRVTGDNATVSGNTMNMTNVSVGGAGAYVNGDGATLTGNTVNVTDSENLHDFVMGADVSGNNATVSGNTVNVGGDTVVSGLAGAGADGENNVLTKNTVNISGNTRFEDDGRGAKVYAAGAWSETDESSNTVSDNTVNVTDNVKLENVDMYGRLKDNKGSGNTLNLNNWKGEIKSVNYFDNVNVNTSSAAKEQVVIGDLAKGNADTKITVNMDSQAARELNPADGTIAGGVREASKIVKLEKVDGNSEHDETIHVNMAEGDLVGNISADVTESGRISGLVEKENSIISSLRMIGANNFLVFRQQMNDLEKRMGDLRTMPQSDGAWARVVAGQAEYKGLHSTYKTVQAGADKRIGQFVIGATASYTDADGTMKRLGTDDKNYTYGIYGSWLGDNGHFVDVIVKRHHVASEFDARYADGRKVDGSTHTSGTSLSVEYGKRFGITNTNFYVEPQVEVMWGKLDSDSYKLSNGVKVSQDSIDSFIGRLGVAAGWVSPEKKGSAYIKASVLNDWEADADMKAKKGGIVKKFHEDMGGTWGEFVIGGTYNFSKSFSAYGEIETSAGNPTKTTYQASAGIRYSF